MSPQLGQIILFFGDLAHIHKTEVDMMKPGNAFLALVGLAIVGIAMVSLTGGFNQSKYIPLQGHDVPLKVNVLSERPLIAIVDVSPMCNASKDNITGKWKC